MKKSLTLLSIVSGILVLGFKPLQAAPIPELSQFLQDQLESADTAFADNSDPHSSGAPSSGTEWYYKRFWLRVRGNSAIGIPGIVKVTILPEVEMLWQRENPKSFESYKP